MTKDRIWLIAQILLLFFVAFSTGYFIGILGIRGNTYVIPEDSLQIASRLNNKQLKRDLEECQRYNIFQQAIKEIGEKEYSEEYDCYDHAVDLQKKLRENNIESSIFINDGENHVWLGIWLETTKGEFISPDSNYKIRETR